MAASRKGQFLAILCFLVILAGLAIGVAIVIRSSFSNTPDIAAPTGTASSPAHPAPGQLRVVDDRYLAAMNPNAGLPHGRKHIIESVRMGPAGQIWAATEGEGVGYYDPAGQQWHWFKKSDGLPETDVYCLALDQQGRIWAGVGHHGVSVYNGRDWKNYNVEDGPLGQRVFAIAVCPVDGDVWLASDCGLSRYSVASDAWSYLTRADGLISDQLSSLTFDSRGDLYVATQCDGIAIARRADNYHQWTTVSGESRMPLTSRGSGLPSNMVNDVLATPGGIIYAATQHGLALSTDQGKSWSFIRGHDWKAFIDGLDAGPAATGDGSGAVLTEDRCTCLALDGAGEVWVGHYHTEADVLDGQLNLLRTVGRAKGKSIDSILPVPGAGLALLGAEEAGMISSQTAAQDSSTISTTALPPPAFPSPAKAPATPELDALIRNLASSSPANVDAAFITDDWTTLGDWIGRFGSGFATICSFSPDPVNTAGYSVSYALGPKGIEGPFYDQYGDHGKDPRWLAWPHSSNRRIGEWNDGAWQQNNKRYPETLEGPDLWLTVDLPDGLQRVAIYFFNKGSPTGTDDHEIEVRKATGDLEASLSQPPLAHARARHFTSGVYKEFALRGPGEYWIRLARNGSEFTQVQAVMIDPIPARNNPPGTPSVFQPPAIAESAANTSPAVTKARELWAALDRAAQTRIGIEAQRPYRTLAYRAALAAGAGADLLSNWRWKLHIWTLADRADFESNLGLAN